MEVKKCEKTSDRICRCRAGYMPAGYPLGSGELVMSQAPRALASSSHEMVVISSAKAVVVCLTGTSPQVLQQGSCANCCSVIPELSEILTLSLLISIISQ